PRAPRATMLPDRARTHQPRARSAPSLRAARLSCAILCSEGRASARPIFLPRLKAKVGRAEARPSESLLLRRDLVRHIFHRFLDLFDIWMDLANEIVLDLRKFLDPPGHVVQFFQHHFLARGESMHPPEANPPTSNADPSENKRDCLDIETQIHLAIVRA